MRPEPRLQGIFFGGIALILLALLISWWLRNFELVEEEYRSGISLEARRNPFLAAELFLREMGTDVESVSGRQRLHELPPSTDILVVNDFDGSLSQDRYEKLLDWIESGGHIVITATRFWDEDRQASGNRLLDDLGIRLKNTEGIDAETVVTEGLSTVVTVNFEDGDTAEVAFRYSSYLEDSENYASATVNSELGTHLLQIPYGDGMITVLSDNHFLKNPRSLLLFGLDIETNSIEDHDHAYFLWLLMGDEAKVWLVYDIQSPSLSALLWQNAPQACIAFILLLMFWLWSVRNRFGPPMAAIDPPRRNLLEHLLMSANYEWHLDKADIRVHHNRELLQQEIRSKHPNIALMEPADMCQALAKISGIVPEKIDIALFRDWKGEREFIQLSNLLRTLRQKI